VKARELVKLSRCVFFTITILSHTTSMKKYKKIKIFHTHFKILNSCYITAYLNDLLAIQQNLHTGSTHLHQLMKLRMGEDTPSLLHRFMSPWCGAQLRQRQVCLYLYFIGSEVTLLISTRCTAAFSLFREWRRKQVHDQFISVRIVTVRALPLQNQWS
jgi:hypothetical protein